MFWDYVGEYDDSDLESSEDESSSEGFKTDPEIYENDYRAKVAEEKSRASVPKPDEVFKTKIFSTLKQVKTPSAFAFSAIDWYLPNPGLHLPACGTLGLPLSTDDAQKIISQARQSPFGKGEATLVDTLVRKSWELNPSQFSLKNPVWSKVVEKIVDSVTTGLGLEKGTGKVTAELHKLLLYEPGAFFKPHKDSEKAPGMFATLVVCLPSPHEGGKLVLTHEGEKYEFETASSSSVGGSYAAWYSDITHEVLPVVSGHRLVLTYNLIRQNDYRVPSHDLVHGCARELSSLLEEYNSLLEAGDDKLPPVLVHQLEHKYTQVSLKFKALKPPDLALVQVLKQLATRLGFGVYLATLVLEVMKDDEDPDYRDRQSRSQVLENVVELDGALVDKSVYYPEGALIDPKGQAEEEAFKEDHEGPTGNEGSPATYWYRDTVVVLVPPSKLLHLVFKFKYDGSVIEPLFCKLMCEFAQDPAQTPKLEQLCKLALMQIPEKRYNYKRHQHIEDIPPFFRQAVATALDLGRVDLFDEAYRRMCDRILLDDADALGCSTATNGFAAMTDRLINCLLIVSSVAQKVEFLKAVAEGFETAVPKPSAAKRVSLKQWSDEALFTAVAKLPTLTKADGISLARLCKTFDWNLFESKAKPIILKPVTKAKITFVNELMSILQQELNEKQRSFVETVIRSIWNEFVFEAESDKPRRYVSSYIYGYHHWDESERERAEGNLKEDDILHIVEHSVKIFSSNCVETIIIPAILTAIPLVSEKCTEELFIPLVQMILGNKLAGFRLPTSNTVPPLSHKRLVQALLTKFLSENIRPEPEPPTDTTLPARPCKCSDCAVVNTFLQDPNREKLKYTCKKRQREHLTRIFGFYFRSCRISWSGIGSPYVWEIRKNHRSNYEGARNQWKSLTDYITKPLKALKTDEAMGQKLKAYLEPYYDVIMNVDMKNLPDLKVLVMMPQSSEKNEIAASAPNQSTKSGVKRGGEDIDPPEDGNVKQRKS